MLRRFALVALLAVSSLAFSTPPAELPPLPTTIFSVLGPIEIHVVPNLVCDGQKVIGCYSGAQRMLAIRDSLPLITGWRVLEHERLHVINRDAGIPYTPDEERQAEAISMYRVAEMLARPR